MNSSSKIKVHPSREASSRIRESFRTAIIIRIIFGYNLMSASAPRLLYNIVNTYCLSVAIAMSVFFCYLIIYMPSEYIVPGLVLIEYVITVLVSCVRSFSVNYFTDIEVVDSTLAVCERNYAKLRLISNVIFITVIVNRVAISLTCYMLQNYCLDSPIIILLLSLVLIAIELNQIPRVIFFSMVYFRMKMLRKKIKAHFDAQNFISSIHNNSGPTIEPLTKYLKLYAEILDNADNVARRINPLFMLSLVCCFPKMMCHLYKIVVLSRTEVSVVYMVILAMDVVLWGAVACLPGVVAECVAAEVDQVRQLLMRQRLQGTMMERHRVETDEFLGYIEARPFRYRIWRLIPVDLSLPVGLLGLCTTYFIVVIQFSHLFE